MKYIGLLDCNNFFVSCERLFRPDLIGKPVIVLSSNDGCVVARSEEVKDIGISMGVPYFQIKDIVKKEGVIIFSSHFSLYRDISRRVFELARQHLESIEQYSIDECFFEFESDEPMQYIANLKRQVEQGVGIPVSVGVASSKTRAKHVSHVAKKTGGLAVWSNEDWKNKAPEIRLSEIWGVGFGRSRNFGEKGIATVADLLKIDKATVARLFGVEGVRLQAELAGVSLSPVKNQKLSQKSVMSTRSFATTTTDLAVLEDAVRFHLYQVIKDLEDMDLLASSLRITISPSRHGDYALQGASSETLLISPTKDMFALQRVAVRLLTACYKPGVPYKKAGVILSNLVANESTTKSLFAASESKDQSTAGLTETVLAINKHYGKTLIQLGRKEEGVQIWRGRKDSLSPDYTTNWTDVVTVKA